jgi:adenylate cyclase
MRSNPNRPVVLIVDDTPTNISVIAGLLKESFITKVATNGERALAIAQGEDKLDLILLDVSMPGMDGYEVCRHLKADARTEEIPVIFLTARTESEEEQAGFTVGAVDYVHKPFSGPILLARINTQLQLQHAVREARAARKEADELLHALLPDTAAEEIRSIGTVIPRRFEDVAVLFCDVVDFTSYCDKHQPEDVVARLDALFVLFEQAAAKHGLEKLKTVGDAFMAAAGLLHPIDDPFSCAVRCGLDMITFAAGADLEWEVRVGVHTGPVVAGIVGQERYQFDIWGDTVNVAARLTAKAHPGGLAVTAEQWSLVSEEFSGEPLGELEVKGKGWLSVVEVRNDGDHGRA